MGVLKTAGQHMAQALRGSLWVSAILGLIFAAQQFGSWWQPGAVSPRDWSNLPWGLAYPLLHASLAHWSSNALAIMVLGTLAFGLYPRAAWRTLPLAWLTSFAAIWLFGSAGSHHLGASGLIYAAMALITALGIRRREVPAIAAGLLVLFLFGGAWWAMLPLFPEVSWQGHVGGALGGVLGALFWAHLDPSPFPVIVFEDEPDDVELPTPPREIFAPLG